ncbi:SGNH/GDSL hydrolase family protein [Nocardia sp. NBC_00511]|uniref:SGNH/GDSL hydrolase family protein n=1 Tax=Nocardia sp. NBC_00511 TaxID=2903591 RepID=UPI0030DE6043
MKVGGRVAIGSAVVTAAAMTGMAVAAVGAAEPVYNYVALGDSYTAATGFDDVPDGSYAPPGCFQAHTDYPHQIAGLLGGEHRLGSFADASCGGATITAFTNPQHTIDGVNAPQFSRIDGSTNLVTIGIGGNDVGLEALVEECARDGLTNRSCMDAHVRDGVDDISASIARVEPKLEAVIRDVRARAANDVRILIVDYLEAMPDSGAGCYPEVPILPADAAWFAGTYRQLDAALATAAANQSAELVDTYAPTLGHNVCSNATTRYVEFLTVVSSNPPFSLAAPVHPNIGGANAQTRLVAAAIG